MPFTGIVHPEELDVLTKALDSHCTEFGIEPMSPAHFNAGRLAVILFESGVTKPEDLAAALRRKAAPSKADSERDRQSE